MTSAALNAVCPYYTMYPLSFPLRVLQTYGAAGQWVVDPFCGRGTTNYAARLLGMPSIGIDSSPVATALAHAKLATASPYDVVECARTLLSTSPEPAAVPGGEFWQLAFHARTLVGICRLREALLRDCSTPARILLRAIVLGALHGPRPKHFPSYFSNQSPRTFAPKPRYAVKFWTERRLLPEDVDMLGIIAARANRYLRTLPPSAGGYVQLADSRDVATFDSLPQARLVVTSPPYYGMRTYLPDQWLRHWFLGGPERVEYTQPRTQIEHTGAPHFARELGRVWRNLSTRVTSDARLIIRFGGIHDREADPLTVLRESLRETAWQIVSADPVPDSDTGRRQVHQFQATPKAARTEFDVHCHLG